MNTQLPAHVRKCAPLDFLLALVALLLGALLFALAILLIPVGVGLRGLRKLTTAAWVVKAHDAYGPLLVASLALLWTGCTALRASLD